VGDNEVQNRYTRAKNVFAGWLRDGVLKEETEPALYSNYQIYTVNGEKKTRKGLTCMVRVHPLGEQIHPHESTHVAPKEDRFRLLQTTGAFFEHVFMLYSDEEKRVAAIQDRYCQDKPVVKCVDDYGESNVVWKIQDKDAINEIKEYLHRRELIIADGHHRYEATLRLSKETGKPRYILVTLCNIEDELFTFATHRAIFDCRVSLKQLISLLSTMFDVVPYSTDEESVVNLLEDVRIEGLTLCTFGMVTPHGLYLLKLRGKTLELDVNILHQLILDRLLDVTPVDIANEQKVHFYRSEREVINRTLAGEYEVSFLVNPVKISQIKALVRQGKRFPQKTTDFYPKLVSGLVMAKFV
jgi:uncharacterized protein (DUF1015 family)